MATLSRTRDPAELRERNVRWAEWEARATVADAKLRKRARLAWMTLAVAIVLTATLL